MLSTAIDIHDLDEGIDRKQLALLKQRFSTLNQQRYDRTCAALAERQRQFLALLPLLFHVNHPMLPGYLSHHTPCGVVNFKPGKDELRLAKTWARSFTFSRDFIVKHPAIDAVFVMGSVGTIAHSDSSDLDIWVCHDPSLSPKALADLQAKCQRLHQWAEDNLHLEAHFFLMTGQSFQTRQTAEFSSEGSGSAQHFLLLDEFYRTALWLAGKIPLWWFVPASQEQHYEHYSQSLLRKRFIRAADVIDFGGIPAIPPNEFIGAGIWQLYKGIEAPYKSVLKLLLLETYASTTNNEPLALTFKRAVYQCTPDASLLDPYVMIYRRLEEYLLSHGQLQRLELVRRCFYFKVNKPLTRSSCHPQKSWQRLLLETLTAQWGWPTHQLHLLDDRRVWKAPRVIAERTLLVNELSNSYRLISDIHRRTATEAAITNDELMILGRKLHAAFERKAGKIEWINPQLSADISEASLCLVQETEASQESWQLYRGSQQRLAQRTTPAEPIKRSRHLMEALLWAYGNGILTPDTRLDVVSTRLQLSPQLIQQVLQILRYWLPLPLAPVDHHCFKQNTQINRLLLLFNLGVEPQADLHKKGMQMLSSQRDALGYSGFRENLVLTADVIQTNTWQEILCRHYGKDALIHSLLHYLRMLPPGRGLTLPELTIRCFNASQGHTITQRLEELWRDIIACYYSGTRPRNCRYILEMGDEYLLLQFLQQQPHITRYGSYGQLIEKLANAQTDYSPIVVDRYALKDQPLKLFAAAMNIPGIYVFYQLLPQDESVLVSILDEKGSLFTTKMTCHSPQALLKPLLQFIRSCLNRQMRSGDSAPQPALTSEIHCYELLGKVQQGHGYLEARNVGIEKCTQTKTLRAVAASDEQGEIQFTLYCDQHAFSWATYGEDIYLAVAAQIRKENTRAPDHSPRYSYQLTDLDLSPCKDLVAPQTGLQLIHYLQVKAELEFKIQAAYNAIS